MSNDGRIWLSHTSLEVLERCPKCFWLQLRKGIRQPEGIVSRLANRFDAVIKNYFDKFRAKGKLPPMVADKLLGKLQNPFQEKYYVDIENKYKFYGKLDECLVNEKGEYSPVDFKTSSSDPRDRETLAAYQSQMDDYIYLLGQNGKRTTGEGYLIYFYPDLGETLHDGFPMVVHVQKLKGDPKKTYQRIKNAIKVIEGEMPASSLDCPFCLYRKAADEAENQ